MDKLVSNLGRAVYLLLAAIGIIVYLVAIFTAKAGDHYDFLVSLSAGLIGVTVVFFVVDQFFEWKPEIVQAKKAQDKHEQEMRDTFAGLHERLDRMSDNFEKVVPALFLPDAKSTYRAGTDLITEARTMIRATALGKGKAEAPREWLEAVAEQLRSGKESGRPIYYRLVISRAGDRAMRDEVFAQRGVQDFVEYCPVDTTWGLNVLIVDDKHLVIAFPEFGNEPALRLGIAISNQRDLIRGICGWYDNCVWEKTT